MINPLDTHALVLAPVFTPQGTQLGTIDSVRVDPGSGWPRWASLQTTEGTTLIPLAHATLTAGVLQVPYGVELVRAAPRITPPGAPPSPAQTAQLSAYYGPFDDPTTTPALSSPSDLSTSGPAATAAVPTASPPSSVHPAEDSNPLVATRSEEQLRVATESVPVGTVRVSKHIVTEEKTITVQLRREELRLEHVPLTPTEHPGHGAAHEVGAGKDVVIVLHAEQANVTTEIVPIERVTVHTDVITEQQSLWGTVSHEEVTINDDTQPGRE